MQAFLSKMRLKILACSAIVEKSRDAGQREASAFFKMFVSERGNAVCTTTGASAYPRATDFEKRDEISSRVLALTKAFPLYE